MSDWVFVAGVFDLFHVGHVNLLADASEIGPVVVAVNRDQFAERYKRKPIMTSSERLEVVRACKYVDRAIYNIGDEDCKATIEYLDDMGVNVRYVLHGDDWVGEGLMKQMGFTPGWLAGRGIELVYRPYTKGISSSKIEERVRGR